MNYEETIDYLYNRLPVYQKIGGSAYKEGLDNSLALDKYFGYPHRKYKTIHVGGTNGKGSTSHLLAAVLQQARYKTALYTSPHLMNFRERIRVDGKKIPEQYVIDFIANHKDYYEDIYPSFFELTMMMAFCYFAYEEVNVAIIEVGLGGRLDSTNIITPDLSIITNISIDHTQFLGDTEEKIAAEKAGIIKAGVPVVIGEATGKVRKVFEEKANELAAPILFAEDLNLVKSGVKKADKWLYETEPYPHLEGELGGYAQIKNTATVLATIGELQKIGYTIPDEAVYAGFAHVTELTGLMGRWQVLQKSGPKIICDTGHNKGGVSYITGQLADEKYKTLHIIWGMVNDKDISAVLELLPKNARYYFTKAAIPRAMDEKELQELAYAKNLQGNSYPDVAEAFADALENAGSEDLIFIGGSNFVVADALEFFFSN